MQNNDVKGDTSKPVKAFLDPDIFFYCEEKLGYAFVAIKDNTFGIKDADLGTRPYWIDTSTVLEPNVFTTSTTGVILASTGIHT